MSTVTPNVMFGVSVRTSQLYVDVATYHKIITSSSAAQHMYVHTYIYTYITKYPHTNKMKGTLLMVSVGLLCSNELHIHSYIHGYF